MKKTQPDHYSILFPHFWGGFTQEPHQRTPGPIILWAQDALGSRPVADDGSTHSGSPENTLSVERRRLPHWEAEGYIQKLLYSWLFVRYLRYVSTKKERIIKQTV